MRTRNDRHVFDYKQISAFAVTSRRVNNPRSVFTANIANHFFSFHTHNLQEKP